MRKKHFEAMRFLDVQRRLAIQKLDKLIVEISEFARANIRNYGIHWRQKS